MPKIVAPITACTQHVRVQGQKTGSVVTVYAGAANRFDQVFSGTAQGPDETFALNRRLKAGETVYVKDFISGAETVEPEPAQNELGDIAVDGHLHAFAQCGAFANGYPGAEVRVISTSRGPLGHGLIEPGSGAAHVRFDPAPQDGEDIEAQQTLCGLTNTPTRCPRPDLPANFRHTLAAPTIRGPLRACERTIWIDGVADGAILTFYRDGQAASSACFPYSEGWYRLRRELVEGEAISVDQRFPQSEYRSPRSVDVVVDVPQRPNAPALLGPFCKGTASIGVGDLRFGATVTLVQTSDTQPGTYLQATQRHTVIAEEEAWDALCDIPLFEPLDPARGQYVFAYQSLCRLHSKPSNAGKTNRLRPRLSPPRIVGPLMDCSRTVRVENIFVGARIDILMTCAGAPGARRIASEHVYRKTKDIAVAPALLAGQQVFARQSACRSASESERLTVGRALLAPPSIEECGTHLHVTGVTPGARVEVYKGNSFFKSGRSASGAVRIDLAAPLPAGTRLKARQILCRDITDFGPELVVRDDVEKRRLEVVPIGLPGHPDFSTRRICQLTGTQDPEGKPIRNNCRDAGIENTDLGIVVDHDSGDRRLYFFFGDTGVDAARLISEFPEGGDCLARTEATEAGELGPELDFLFDRSGEDGLGGRSTLVRPRVFGVHGISQRFFEVPTGGFSHAGKLYVFASTDQYEEAPITTGLFKDNNFMGRSVLASAADWDEMFHIVPGHDRISDRSREHLQDPANNGFKFINIAPWKIKNADWAHLPDNAVTEDGLLMIGSGRYRESQPCLAYVPLPGGRDPDFAEWRYLSGYAERGDRTGPCGKPAWSARQEDAIFLWDDGPFFSGNSGVLGELSMAYLPSVRLFVTLYVGGKLRSAEFPWGPWSDPIDLFDFGRDHAAHDDPGDPRPRYIAREGATYGPYIVPRFTTYDPELDETTLYYAMSTWRPYQVSLLETKVRPACGYRDAKCGSAPG